MNKFPTLSLVTGPASEPIGISDARLQCSLGTDTSWDAFLNGAIAAARRRAEKKTGRAIITQTWEAYFDYFPRCGEIILPLGKLQAVTGFAWTDSANGAHSWTVSGSNLLSGSTTMAHIDTLTDPGRIVLAYGQSWPTEVLKTSNPIKITFRAGYGDDPEDVHEDLRWAMRLDIGFLFRFRESVVASDRQTLDSVEVPMGYADLIADHKLYLV